MYFVYSMAFNVLICNRVFSAVHILLMCENTLSTGALVAGKQNMYSTILAISSKAMSLFSKCLKHSTQRSSHVVLLFAHSSIFPADRKLSTWPNCSNSSDDFSESKRHFSISRCIQLSISDHCGFFVSRVHENDDTQSREAVHFTKYA